jgi:hypothetical protein
VWAHSLGLQAGESAGPSECSCLSSAGGPGLEDKGPGGRHSTAHSCAAAVRTVRGAGRRRWHVCVCVGGGGGGGLQDKLGMRGGGWPGGAPSLGRWAKLGMQGHPSWCSSAGCSIALLAAAHAIAPRPARLLGNCPRRMGSALCCAVPCCAVLWCACSRCCQADCAFRCAVPGMCRGVLQQSRAPCCPASCGCLLRSTSPSVVRCCWEHAYVAMLAAALGSCFLAQKSFFCGAGADPGEWAATVKHPKALVKPPLHMGSSQNATWSGAQPAGSIANQRPPAAPDRQCARATCIALGRGAVHRWAGGCRARESGVPAGRSYVSDLGLDNCRDRHRREGERVQAVHKRPVQGAAGRQWRTPGPVERMNVVYCGAAL